ncbi:TIGR03620 family F420-dependent LLM class oxidoreductase [Streptomyces sp. HNM0574]|uniref:TIGR03620 family F420-dependent LLM class oxidoreductase n=1 Tax=Streptomyces sp. HNM0574 TaxID=2714954 RepID=UPI00146A8C70|nr:TIGR03620 family F420-dependent LLM class oxidoreductase [Streptomyces sp. HNM0574]NLU67801.1 TIGR03620 family F420-dependent LLM class oxidoreductase [Streptomyces sp. HNM0574]
MAPHEHLGTIGIWNTGLRNPDPARSGEIAEAAAELEELGYGTLWLGGDPPLELVEPVLAATSRITVASSILSIWRYEAAELAARHAELSAAHGDRLLIGLGVSHSETRGATTESNPLAARPYTAMRTYLDALDAAPEPLPAERRALAALGPKMLKLASERTLGALPYLVTAEHTARARETLGAGALLAPELKVVLDTDRARARATARGYLSRYLALENYRNSLLRLGFTEDDFPDGGSDRLLDAVYAIGDADTAASRTEEFLAAGADHVAVQVVLPEAQFDSLPCESWRTLARALPLDGRGAGRA